MAGQVRLELTTRSSSRPRTVSDIDRNVRSMERSDELRALMAEVVDIYMDGDEVAWGRLWSARPGVISLGTDPREWWEPVDVIIALHAKQARERGTGTVSEVTIAAFQEGSVGWAVMSGQAEWAG